VKVTVHDVARHAGVSVATVSRALSGSRRVSPEMAARVADSARVLGYRYNAVARALRRSETNAIGMVVPEISNPFFPAIVEAVERGLQETGRDLFLCDAQLSADTERRRVQALLSRQVDGLIITPVSATASRPSLLEPGSLTPLVQLDRYVTGFPADWVGVDDVSGITQIVDHVAGLGVVHCVFVSATLDSSSAQLRSEGFAHAARAAGITPRLPDLLGEFSIEWGRLAALRILSAKPYPEAVICGNDEIAVGLLREFRRHGIRVPEDVVVTGFDDIGFAALTEPALTTVRQPREQLAMECIRLLDARIADPSSPVRRVALAPSLVVRESTGGRS
jgi:LacI family transcriptional regulator